MPESPDSFYNLGPEQVLQAIESVGFECDGSQMALNSYENRVYQIGIEDEKPVVAKFYRPNRWKDEAILEEHGFTLELNALEIPVVAPLEFDGETLFTHNNYRFSLYPLRGGRAPDLENMSQLKQLGRFMGRIHALGSTTPFEHRPTLDVKHFGDDSYNFLLESGFIPPELESAYETLAEDLLDHIDHTFTLVKTVNIRLHGDCHPGNIMWTDSGPHIVDFDDARMGPAVQDIWMFLTGSRNHKESALAEFLEGYTPFFDFDLRQLALIEGLRTLRMMHYAAWIGRRWDDPAFKYAFPWFNSQNYWEDHILSLKEQASALHEEPLQWV
ncbi:MAG: serine/threonine protein kinase [Mariprofundaceae bacterium]|nr:serine/threonine protein kinase [Mariprofundaceae bacterium]